MRRLKVLMLTGFLVLTAATVDAGQYSDTIALFKNAGDSATFFGNCYGYAVFPSVGQGALVVGGAHGNGHVYEHDKYVGDTSMTQVSVGFQAGGRAYSMIVFFQDQRAFQDFTRGDYEFSADVNAVATTAGASGSVGTSGANSGASAVKSDAKTSGSYYKGMAVFTIVKGGAMFQAAVAGQKFTYAPRSDT
jgi:lipid-binding SYLF domain-containing protein